MVGDRLDCIQTFRGSVHPFLWFLSTVMYFALRNVCSSPVILFISTIKHPSIFRLEFVLCRMFPGRCQGFTISFGRLVFGASSVVRVNGWHLVSVSSGDLVRFLVWNSVAFRAAEWDGCVAEVGDADQ